MNQDTIPPYRYEVVKYVSAISGTDTSYKFETVPVYLDHSRTPAPKPRAAEKPAQITAFDTMKPGAIVQFNTEPPMAQQLAHLIEVKPKAKAEELYPWNDYVHGFTLFVLLITSALITVQFYNFINETRCNLRAKRLANAERLRNPQNING